MLDHKQVGQLGLPHRKRCNRQKERIGSKIWAQFKLLVPFYISFSVKSKSLLLFSVCLLGTGQQRGEQGERPGTGSSLIHSPYRTSVS